MAATELDRAAIAGREQLIFAPATAAPYRPDRMDHMLGRQAISACNFRAASFAAAQRTAFRQQLWARGTMNCAIHAAPAE